MYRFLLTAAFIVAPAAASAQENASPSRETGVYLRGAGGIALGGDLDQDLSWNPNFAFITAPPSAKSTDLGNGLALSAAIGFQYRNTRTELEYRRIENSVDAVAYSAALPGPVVPVNEDLVADALMSNVYFDFVNASALTPYVGFGVGGARVENELGERDAAFAYQGRAGVEFAMSRNLSLGAEYVYFRTLNIAYGPDEDDFTPTGPAGPRTDGDAFVSSSVMGTVRLVF